MMGQDTFLELDVLLEVLKPLNETFHRMCQNHGTRNVIGDVKAFEDTVLMSQL
jgi:hypothetical protein